MAMIIGKCQHGVIQVAAHEDFADQDTLEEMAHTYDLERIDSVSLGGECIQCKARYLRNMDLLLESANAQ